MCLWSNSSQIIASCNAILFSFYENLVLVKSLSLSGNTLQACTNINAADSKDKCDLDYNACDDDDDGDNVWWWWVMMTLFDYDNVW